MVAGTRYSSPFRFYGLAALLASSLGALLLGLLLSWSALFSWLVSVNAVAFVFYGLDKRRARTGGRRVPENVLWGIVLLGGGLGGLCGMLLFRHKTRKGSFQFVFWTIVLVEVVAGCAWLMMR